MRAPLPSRRRARGAGGSPARPQEVEDEAVVGDQRGARQRRPLPSRSQDAVILLDKDGVYKLPDLLTSTESKRFSLQPNRWRDPRAHARPRPADISSPPPGEARRARSGGGPAPRTPPPASPSDRKST